MNKRNIQLDLYAVDPHMHFDH